MRKVNDMPTSYTAAAVILADKEFRNIANNTWLRRINDYTIQLGLHSTAIVEWRRSSDNDETVTLHTGGYRTVTTKARMNAALFGTRYHIEQRDFRWYVYDRVLGESFEFCDGDTWNLCNDFVPRERNVQ